MSSHPAKFLILLLLAGTVRGQETPVAVAPKTAAVASTAATPAAPAAPVAAMNAATLLPVGVPSYDVRMPEFSGDRLVSRMRTEKLVRIDASRLDLTRMDLERYRPDGGLDYVVSLERGFYDLETGRLVSSSPTHVRGQDMEMHGDGCDYAKEAEIVKILGKVTSYLYLEEKKNPGGSGDAPAREPTPPPIPTDKP